MNQVVRKQGKTLAEVNQEARQHAEERERIERRNSFRFGLREQIRRIVTDGGTHAGIAVAADVELATLQDWLGGKPAPELENALADWIAQVKAETQVALPVVMTETAETIHFLLETARREKQLVVIVGGPGVGKTTAAEQYRQQLRGAECPIVTVGQKRTGKQGITPTNLYSLILDAMGERGHSHQASRLYDLVCERMGYSWGDNPNLLILDESQDLPWQCLDAIRHLVDEGICGVAVMGNEGEYARMQASPKLQPFTSRVYQTLQLPTPSAADLDAVLNAWGLKGNEVRRAARDVAQIHGLRSLTYAVKATRELARVTGQEITAAMLLHAAAKTIKPTHQ